MKLCVHIIEKFRYHLTSTLNLELLLLGRGFCRREISTTPKFLGKVKAG